MAKRPRFIIEASAKQDAPWCALPSRPMTRFAADHYLALLIEWCSWDGRRYRITRVN